MNPSLEQCEADAETPGDRAVKALMRLLGPSLEGRPILLEQIKKEVDVAVDRAVGEERARCLGIADAWDDVSGRAIALEIREGIHASGTQRTTGQPIAPVKSGGDGGSG